MRQGIRNNQKQATALFDNPLWSIETLSKFLDVPVGTIRDWVFKRQIPFVKAGRLVRFSPQKIQEWLSQDGNSYDRNA